MGVIKLLDETTIDKIAAGEVVEKPASIIKELVENSIDAKASEITVEVRDGGISYIRVIDNGKGINREDVEIAFLRHATSKLKDYATLYSINSLGFRGEALASIAAVSKVEMISKQANDITGTKIIIEGGVKKDIVDCGCPDGTTITIENVFYNTPARLKFLKSSSREVIYITEIMQNIAMSHPEISFKYMSNNKITFITKGDGDLKSVIHSIYGKEVAKNIVEVDGNRDFISVKGFIGNSNIAKSTRNNQHFFVNGRFIKNKTLTAAVENAYKSMLTINKFPFCVVHVLVNPEFVDVNVHPAKAEVKFQDEQIVFKAVYGCIKDSLIQISDVIIETQDNTKANFFKELPKINYSQEAMPLDINTIKNYSSPIIKEDDYKANQKSHAKPIYTRENNIESVTNIETTPVTEDNKVVIQNNEVNYINDKPLENNISNTPKFPPLAVVGQIHFMYIIAEGSDDMYIIDQHAAHERIFYEQYLNEFNNTKIQTQSLLVPVVIDLALDEKQNVFENIGLFQNSGFELEDFGGNSISIRGVPVIYGNPDPKNLFHDILAQITSSDKSGYSVMDKILYTMACKSAIKAGDKMTDREMVELVDRLRFCDNPYNCPHGRPTIIKMSHYELEKKFKRIQ